MLIQDNSRLLFIGDSITDAGRDACGELTPWNRATSLGHGYVALVDAWLTAEYPTARIRVSNRGTSGHTIRDLQTRWQRDVLDERPNWLAICIGINDVWRQFDCPLQPEKHVSPEEYHEIYQNLLTRTLDTLDLKGLVLLTPFMIEPRPDEPMRKRMDHYGGLVRQLAEEHGALLVDTQAAFNRLLQHRGTMEIAWDRIHPGIAGHQVLANAFLRVIGALP